MKRLTRELARQEVATWKKVIRVIAHELNNSLAPISSLAHSGQILAQAPEKLNQDPHGAAWLVKLRLSAPDEAKGLLSAADYQAYVGAES